MISTLQSYNSTKIKRVLISVKNKETFYGWYTLWSKVKHIKYNRPGNWRQF